MDTAPNYLNGDAHRMIAPVLAGNQVTVSTKAGFIPRTAVRSAVADGTLNADDARAGVATWSGFTTGTLTVEGLDRLADEVAGGAGHHLRAVQLPVSLVADGAFRQALDGKGLIAKAAGRGWEVLASAPLHAGELPRLATRELADMLDPGLTIAQACLLAVASCPGVTRILLSASDPRHWAAARVALARPPITVPALRKVIDVLSAS